MSCRNDTFNLGIRIRMSATNPSNAYVYDLVVDYLQPCVERNDRLSIGPYMMKVYLPQSRPE